MSKPSIKNNIISSSIDEFVSKGKTKSKTINDNQEKQNQVLRLSPSAIKKLKYASVDSGKSLSVLVEQLILANF